MQNITLVGFMGTGKSTVGRMLATRLEVGHVDLDDYIVQQTGMDIPTIFREHGESYFRDRESHLLVQLLGQPPRIIITGGGAVLRQENVQAMLAKSLVVNLQAAAEEIIHRVSRDTNRPLLTGDVRERVYTLLRERAGAYDFAPVQIETTGRSIDKIVEEILAHMVEKKVFWQN